jgi:RNA polymerase sigma factor (sigma-70 family)
MTTPAQRESLAGVLADLERFRSFIRRRVADPHSVDDILQDALLRATRHLDQLADTERIDAWFYRIVRNTISDRAGTRSAQALEADPVATAADQAEVCRCLVPLIDRLPADQAEAIRAIDLADGDPAMLARLAGVEINTIHARRSRARAGLRELLQQACRACATHGCQDCDCSPPADGSTPPGTVQ